MDFCGFFLLLLTSALLFVTASVFLLETGCSYLQWFWRARNHDRTSHPGWSNHDLSMELPTLDVRSQTCGLLDVTPELLVVTLEARGETTGSGTDAQGEVQSLVED